MKCCKYRKFLYIIMLITTIWSLTFAGNNIDIISNNQTTANITVISSFMQSTKKCFKYIFRGFEIGAAIAFMTSFLNCMLGSCRNKDE